MIFNLVHRIFVNAMHIPKRKGPRELNFAVKQKDGWGLTCGSCVIYHFLEGYFDVEFNFRHQLPSFKKQTNKQTKQNRVLVFCHPFISIFRKETNPKCFSDLQFQK